MLKSSPEYYGATAGDSGTWRRGSWRASPVPRIPKGIGCEGAGASVTASQSRHANFSRTCSSNFQRRGSHSSVSETATPGLCRRRPPYLPQAQGALRHECPLEHRQHPPDRERLRGGAGRPTDTFSRRAKARFLDPGSPQLRNPDQLRCGDP